MSRDETILLEDVEIIEITGAAVLIEFDDGSSEPEIGVNRFWIPLSVINNDDFDVGDIVDIEVQEWFVHKTDGLLEAVEVDW